MKISLFVCFLIRNEFENRSPSFALNSSSFIWCEPLDRYICFYYYYFHLMAQQCQLPLPIPTESLFHIYQDTFGIIRFLSIFKVFWLRRSYCYMSFLDMWVAILFLGICLFHWSLVFEIGLVFVRKMMFISIIGYLIR